MAEPSLFDDIPASHSNDPITSREAETQVNASGRRAAHCDVVLALVRQHPGFTAVELWQAAPREVKAELVEMQEVRRRLCDLDRRCRVRQGKARSCKIKGSLQVTWELVATDSST